MTKKQRRDKESSAQSHRKKIDGRRFPSKAACLSRAGRGNVNLTCHCQQGKVATRARIAVGSFPVAHAVYCYGFFFMDCEKSDLSGCPMEPPPTEFPIPDRNSVEGAASAARSEVASAPEGSSAWRDELSAKLNHYRARRKAPPPRYPSLRLPFGPLESSAPATAPEAPGVESVANHALALDEVHPAPYIQDPPVPNSYLETESRR